MIVFTSHTRNSSVRRGSKIVQIPGKIEPSGKPILYKISSLMLFLVQDARNADNAPAALVLKERLPTFDIVIINGQKRWQIRRMLPPRIPHCTWYETGSGSIEWYLEHGADLGNLRPEEQWSEREREMFGEYLSDVQKQMMLLGWEQDAAEVSKLTHSVDIDPVLEKRKARARELLDEGLDESEIIEEMIKDFPKPLQRSGKAETEVRKAVEAVLGEE